MLTNIDERSFQLFCYGKYRQAPLPPMTKLEQKIYNMAQAGFPNTSISERISIPIKTIQSRISDIRRKGYTV